jgi:phenylpyruvate tautomerase
MPYLLIQTNQALDEPTEKTLLKKASAIVSAQLGKPPDYAMVVIDAPLPMVLAGSDEPTAYLELKSIGLSSTNTADISAALCKLLSEELSIKKHRVYIEFSNADRSMWGWNGDTV